MSIQDTQAVIFDMDGLIFDSERLFIEAWFKIPEAAELPGLLPLLKYCIGITRARAKELFLKRYGEDFPYDRYREKAGSYFRELMPGGVLPVLPGAAELLSFLKERGMTAVIASSTPEATVRRELADAGLLDGFSDVLGGDHVQNSKPAPDLFLAAAEKIGADPARCLVLEDSYNGIRAAYAAGMTPLMIPNVLEVTEEMKNLALAVFPSLREVKAFLEQNL